MSMQSIRDRYGVPAKRGQRVVVDGRSATITGASRTAEHLMVRLDDAPRRTQPIHPTWRVEYMTGTRAGAEKTHEKRETR